MNISIIIPTYNRSADLKRILLSILAQTILPQEVIVVDQSDDGLTKKLIEEFNAGNFRDIRFIWRYKNEKGSARARNEGFHLSKGDIVCFTDDDVVLEKDYFKEIVDCFEKYTGIGGISGNVQAPESPSGFKWSLRKLLLRIFLIDLLDGKMTVSGFGFPIYMKEVQSLTYVELFAGYSMNFRRQYLEENLFDDFFTGYSFREDVELSYRISRKTALAMIPEARFQHHISRSNRIDSKALKLMQFRNYYYVFNKHKNRSFLSMFLFAYSMGGILIIDLIEWLFGFKRIKWESFTMDLLAVCELIKGRT